jgi:NAD(P)-dependent dehydrogenase (short-subunit alcohol dehydrogenase family)
MTAIDTTDTDLTKSLGNELDDVDIRVNCITPALIETDLFTQMTPEFTTFAKAKIPMGRLGRATKYIVWSESGSQLTGRRRLLLHPPWKPTIGQLRHVPI